MAKNEHGKIFHHKNKIPTYYVSHNGQTKFYTLAGLLLETAGIHADKLGYGYKNMVRDHVYWVLSRFHIHMHIYPVMNQPVIIETWPKGQNKLFYLRDYRMLSVGNELLASATTAWLILDGKTGRPKTLDASDELHNLYTVNQHSIETIPDKLPEINKADKNRIVKARYSDLDINNHVNAVKYIEWIQDCYEEDAYETKNIKEFQINYQLETRFGEEVDIHMKSGSENNDFDYFEGIRLKDQKPAFRAGLRFDKFNQTIDNNPF